MSKNQYYLKSLMSSVEQKWRSYLTTNKVIFSNVALENESNLLGFLLSDVLRRIGYKLFFTI